MVTSHTPLKILTICVPYPHLIMTGVKQVENRTWSTDYRGKLLIHAGKSRAWLAPGEERAYARAGAPLVFGAIVGVVDLVDVLHIEDIEVGRHDVAYPWLRSHEHASGPFCWVMSEPRRLDVPIPWQGAQGLRSFTAWDRLPEGFLNGVA